MYLCLDQSVFGKDNRTAKTILDQLGHTSCGLKWGPPHREGWTKPWLCYKKEEKQGADAYGTIQNTVCFKSHITPYLKTRKKEITGYLFWDYEAYNFTFFISTSSKVPNNKVYNEEHLLLLCWQSSDQRISISNYPSTIPILLTYGT